MKPNGISNIHTFRSNWMKAESSLITSHQIMWLSMRTHFPHFHHCSLPSTILRYQLSHHSLSCLLPDAHSGLLTPLNFLRLSIKEIIFPSSSFPFYRKIILTFICNRKATTVSGLVFKLASNSTFCVWDRKETNNVELFVMSTTSLTKRMRALSTKQKVGTWHVAIAISSLFI